jgi:hypothetical protein
VDLFGHVPYVKAHGERPGQPRRRVQVDLGEEAPQLVGLGTARFGSSLLGEHQHPVSQRDEVVALLMCDAHAQEIHQPAKVGEECGMGG